MKAEFFPPREDIILFNEAPSVFYILVSGSAEVLVQKDASEQASCFLFIYEKLF
jgi:CRP-like cAMP-binding protein